MPTHGNTKVSYTSDALKSLRKHGNMTPRIRKAITEMADGAHANNVRQLVGSSAFRLRVGDFRVIFERTETEIVVTRIAPRGSVYD